MEKEKNETTEPNTHLTIEIPFDQFSAVWTEMSYQPNPTGGEGTANSIRMPNALISANSEASKLLSNPGKDEIEEIIGQDYEEVKEMNKMLADVEKMYKKMPRADLRRFSNFEEFKNLKIVMVREKDSKATYTGTFKDQKVHGWGYFITEGGCYLEGSFKNGQAYPGCQMREITEDGALYVGTFLDNKKHGKGTLIRLDGSFTKCNTWANDRVTGYYEQYNKNGNPVYLGTVNKEGNGPFDGLAYAHYPDATVIATYQKGMSLPIVRREYKDGSVYTGTVNANNEHLPEGTGELIFNDGRKFQGPFVNGKAHGPGTFTSDEGKSSLQTWINGARV